MGTYMLLIADPGLRCLMIEPMRSAAMMKDVLVGNSANRDWMMRFKVVEGRVLAEL